MQWVYGCIFILGLSACADTIEQRGVQLDPDRVAKIQIGQSSINDVMGALGSPAASSNFGEPSWYYINQRMQYWAFREPKIKAQDITIIRFDRSGIVSAIEQKSLADAKTVQSVGQSTPSAESQLTILQQLLGNVGRFSGRESTK